MGLQYEKTGTQVTSVAKAHLNSGVGVPIGGLATQPAYARRWIIITMTMTITNTVNILHIVILMVMIAIYTILTMTACTTTMIMIRFTTITLIPTSTPHARLGSDDA